MKRKSIALALTLAAAATVTSPVWAQSSSAMQTDRRIAINVSQAEKNQVLSEMREFLHGYHSLNSAMARQDMKALGITARPMGALLDRMPVKLKERLPEEFTQLAIAMNVAFQNLARDAEDNGDMRKAHENLAEVMTYCSGCHDTYRFNVAPIKARK
jgi:recombinational DNA repair protein RecR